MSILDSIKAISDEARARIVGLLSIGAFNVQELTSTLELSQSTMSHHLKTLLSAGIIKTRKEGTWSYYALESGKPEADLARELCAKIALENGEIFSQDLKHAKDILTHRRDRTKLFFDSVAGSWRELRKLTHGHTSFLEELAAEIPPAATVLELGCGSGALLEKIVPRDGQTIGVDSSQSMLDEAKKALGSRAVNVDLRLGYLEHLPVGDDSIDLVVAYMVFHHVTELERALSDALRVLKPGCEIFIIERTHYDKSVMRERFGELWFDFSTRDLIETLKRAGFVSVQSRQIGDKQYGQEGEATWLSAKKI